MNKLIVILGPTASGKTDLSIKLAKKYNGQIVSADSRQVYRGLDVGSAKITKKEMQGIPHYLLSVANPKRKFSVAQYQKLALRAIKNIQKEDKLPFLVGGTGFYIQSVVDGIVIPEVKPDWVLRKKLEKKSNQELFKLLLQKDPERAKNIDKNNPRRLIRALEIILKTGKAVPKFSAQDGPASGWNVLQIGILKNKEELKKNINKRLLKRINFIIKEVKKIYKNLSWNRLEEFGLEYRYVAQYLQNKISKEKMIQLIQKESEHFAKRQMTWFKKDQRINWITNNIEAKRLIDDFLK